MKDKLAFGEDVILTGVRAESTNTVRLHCDSKTVYALSLDQSVPEHVFNSGIERLPLDITMLKSRALVTHMNAEYRGF